MDARHREGRVVLIFKKMLASNEAVQAQHEESSNMRQRDGRCDVQLGRRKQLG